jgi:hypothetical protein
MCKSLSFSEWLLLAEAGPSAGVAGCHVGKFMACHKGPDLTQS